jgi:hypothetical protein
MSDDEPVDAPRQPKPEEVLFTFEKGANRFRCELRAHDGGFVEAQFFNGDDLVLGQMFRDRQDAIDWANRQRDAWLKDWWI